MSQTLKHRLIYGGLYTLFFVFAFVVSAYLTFPYERLRDLLVTKLAGSGDADALVVQLGSLEPSWFTGVELEDVDITRPASGDGEAATLHFDAVTVRAKLLPLLIGRLRLSLDAEVGDGTIDATYAHGEIREIAAEIDALDVGALGLGAWVGVPMRGFATGAVEMALDETATKAEGDIALSIDGLRVGDGKAKLKVPGMAAGVTLDEIQAGKLDLLLKVTAGVATLERLTTTGPDLKLDGTGTVRLTSPMRRSRVDLQLGLGFSDGYKNKSDRTKGMFSLLELGDWKRATGSDGVMRLQVGGTLQALRATPGTGTSGRASASSRAAERRRARGILGNKAREAAKEKASPAEAEPEP